MRYYGGAKGNEVNEMAYLNGKRTVRCRLCYGKGHNRSSCPTLPEAERKENVKSRKCSWCSASGHTKRTCKQRVADREKYIVTNATYRQEVLNLMKVHGLGVGSLVGYTKWDSKNKDDIDPETVCMITDIKWDEIQQKKSYHRIFKTTYLHDTYNGSLALELDENYTRQRVVCKVSADKIQASVPSSWLDGKSNIDQFF